MKYFYYFLIFVFLLGACTDKSEFKKTIKLTGEEIINTDSLGNADDILSLNNEIILLDKKPLDGNSYIKIYNTNGKKLQDIGKTGRGPGEYQSPSSLNKVLGTKNQFSVYDLHNLILTSYETNNSGNFILDKIISVNRGMPHGIVSLENKEFVYLGLGLTKGRIGISDTSGNMFKQIGDIPPGKQEGTPVNIHLQAWQGDIKLSPDKSKIVAIARFSDNINVFDRNGNLLTKIVGTKNFIPLYSTVKNGDIPVMAFDTENSIRGYADVAVSNEYIYALYAGTSFLAPIDSTSIHVFDYKGEHIKKILLDKPLSSFDVDFNNDVIYGIGVYPNKNILKFKIK